MAVEEPRDWTDTTLGERVEHVRVERFGGISLHKLGAMVGIERGPMSRYVKPKNRKGGATPEVLARMADAWKVSFPWLALGRGQPDDVQPWERSKHPNLEVAIAFHRGRFSSEAVAEVRSMSLKRDDDPDPETWSGALRAVQAEHDLARLDPERAARRSAERQEHTKRLGAQIVVRPGGS